MKTLKRIATVLVLIPLALELIIRLYVSSHPASAAALPSVPVPYQHSAYYGAAFVAEGKRLNSGFTLDDNGFLIPPEFHGIYFNVEHGYRVTTDQPHTSRTLWLLGASTVFDGQVPDAYTKASYLQRLVGTAYRVQNLGMQSIDIGKELSILKQQNVRPGDIVMMLDGAPDMFSARETTINRRQLEPSPCKWLTEHANWSLLIQAACATANTPLAPDLTLIRASYDSYARATIQAHDWTVQHGAQFYHFLQPMIYSAATPGPDADMWRAAYGLYRTTPDTIDLTSVYKGHSDVTFFDEIHTSEVGNSVVARALYDALVF